MKFTFSIILAFFLFILPSFKMDKQVQIVLLQQDENDIVFVKSVYASLMAAESVAKVLNVDVVMDDVNSDLIIFTVNSNEQAELSIKIFDEEGFETVANTTTVLSVGKNYKALNVRTVEDGSYIFELSNENGEKFTKIVEIKNN